MSDFFKEPQIPLNQKNITTGDNYYIYPLTTDKQVIMEDGSRLNAKINNLTNVILGKASAKTSTATLFVGKWSTNEIITQTVLVFGVLADSDKQAIISVADPGSLDMYLDCNVRLIGSGNGSLTFSCEEIPSENIIVNILIINKGE